MDKEEAALIVIESPDTTTAELARAFRDLRDTIDSNEETSYPLRMLNACVHTLTRHADPVEYRALWLNIIPCLEHAVDWDYYRDIDSSPAIAPLLAYEWDPVGRLLDALVRCGKSDEELRLRLSAAIASILTMGTEQEITSIINRYSEPMKKAFIHMGTYHLGRVVAYKEYARLIIRDSSLLEFIVNELRGTKNPGDLAEISNVAVTLMATAVKRHDNKRLEHMLGLGAMKSAGLLVQQPSRSWRTHARIYTKILDRHPEWKEYFKQSTKDGDPDNAITTVGRRINDRPKAEPTLYVLVSEEQAELPPTTVPSCPTASTPKEEEAEVAKEAAVASKEEEAAKEATFADLPPHFLDNMARTMSFADMANFRLVCKKTLAAVDQRGRSIRALDIVRLARELWPGKHGHSVTIDSLHDVQHEIARLADWVGLDAINFTGVGTMNASQLHTIFGTEPRLNVQKVDLVGVVVMPRVWSSLASLFPGVISVRCTEKSCLFPASIKQEAMIIDGEKIGGRDLADRSGLVNKGLLGEDRVCTLRCIKMLFPEARYMHID